MVPDVINCPSCAKLTVKSKFRDVCEECYKAEEKIFDAVYRYMRKRENRAATIPQIIEATGVEEALLLKFIKNGRLQQAHFPNLGYPCDKCGGIIHSGKICGKCVQELKAELEIHAKEEMRKQEVMEQKRRSTYLSGKNTEL